MRVASCSWRNFFRVRRSQRRWPHGITLPNCALRCVACYSTCTLTASPTYPSHWRRGCVGACATSRGLFIAPPHNMYASADAPVGSPEARWLQHRPSRDAGGACGARAFRSIVDPRAQHVRSSRAAAAAACSCCDTDDSAHVGSCSRTLKTNPACFLRLIVGITILRWLSCG